MRPSSHYSLNPIPMSSLKERIETEIKTAMRERNSIKLEALRAIKAAILLAQTEKGASEQLSEQQEMQILMKQVRQRKESYELYQSQNRSDLAEREKAEMEVIETFLPKMMDENEIKAALSELIAQMGGATIKEMGKVMGMATKALAGKAENQLVSKVVKELLS
ncbi:GatB/YqeY domain-containing protein [Hugenholtzia roseola]|uniref:GatB/YqeY domain-containing protein n=1 Tax=Hugenholtzia roseola TaxID=1002 RepID=UPI00041DF19D